jgi:predicted GTPase
MNASVDLQCQAILKGLLDLEKLLDNPLADKVLDLKDNATTSKNKDLLIRLRKSLVQYLERTGDLVYIALIGHFSSGKSSTINSLLDLWDSSTERPVGLNPTDKAITLITHKKNANSLLGVVGQGSVPFRLEPLENNLLESMVLADTPGTGDPQFIQEMARDFLPVCDLVLFFFSAASPLDTTDIPLLTELHRRLPFIPIRFIITRADELRIDDGQPVSSNNFDHGKAAAFIAEVMSRITLLLRVSKHSDNDFLLIDNKAQFNIELLRKDLLSRSDPANLSNRLTMHSHKVRFFQTTAENLRDYFSKFVDTKLAELNRIVSTADKNIQRFNEGVIITNNNLTKSWFDHHSMIQDLKVKASERIKSLPDFPDPVTIAEPISKLISEMQLDITRHAGWVAGEVRRHIMQTGFVQFKRDLSQVEESITEIDLDDLSPHDHGLTPITIKWTFGDIELVPINKLSRNVDGLQDKLRTYVLSVVNETRRAYEDILRALQQRYIVDKCEQIIDTAQSSLVQDLDMYFQNVQVYRTGVFAMSTKSSIGRLGIGAELDQYETEFTDEDKESIKLEAKQRLFPSYGDIVAEATTQLAKLTEQVRLQINDMANVQLESPTSSLARIELAVDEPLSKLLSEVKNELHQETGEFVGSLQTKLEGVIAFTLNEYNKERDAASRDRKIRYATFTGVTGAGAAIAYYIYYKVKQPVGQSLFEVLGWGLLIEIIGNMLGFGMAFFKDKYPVTKHQIKTRYLVLLKERISKTIDEAVRDYSSPVLQQQVFGRRLEKIYTALSSIPNNSWRASVDDLYRKARTWNTQYKEIRRKYLSVIESVTKETGRYFEDAQGNLAALKSTANEIKEHAIEPSFSLLANTSERLSVVKDDISAIRFT